MSVRGRLQTFSVVDCLLANLRMKRSESRPLLFGCLLARLEVWGAALDFFFAGCLFACLSLKEMSVDLFYLGACLLGCESGGRL